MSKINKTTFIILLSVCCLCLMFLFRYQISHWCFTFYFKEEALLVKNTTATILNGNEIEIKRISTNDANILKEELYPLFNKLEEMISVDDIVIKYIYKGTENGKKNMYVEGFFGTPPARFSMRFVINESDNWLLKLFVIDDHYFLKKLK